MAEPIRSLGESGGYALELTGVGRRFILELEAGKPSCQLGRALVVAAAVGLRTFDLMSANNDADNALLPDLIDDLPEPEDDGRG